MAEHKADVEDQDGQIHLRGSIRALRVKAGVTQLLIDVTSQIKVGELLTLAEWTRPAKGKQPAEVQLVLADSRGPLFDHLTVGPDKPAETSKARRKSAGKLPRGRITTADKAAGIDAVKKALTADNRKRRKRATSK